MPYGIDIRRPTEGRRYLGGVAAASAKEAAEIVCAQNPPGTSVLSFPLGEGAKSEKPSTWTSQADDKGKLSVRKATEQESAVFSDLPGQEPYRGEPCRHDERRRVQPGLVQDVRPER